MRLVVTAPEYSDGFHGQGRRIYCLTQPREPSLAGNLWSSRASYFMPELRVFAQHA